MAVDLQARRAQRDRAGKVDTALLRLRHRVLAEYSEEELFVYLSLLADNRFSGGKDGLGAAQVWDLEGGFAVKVLIGLYTERREAARLLRLVADRIEQSTDGVIAKHFSEQALDDSDLFALGPGQVSSYEQLHPTNSDSNAA